MSLFSVIKTLKKTTKPPACTAVIAAAGSSQRCKGEDKLFYLINEKPVLFYAVEAFQNNTLINEIIIVAQENRFEYISELCSMHKFNKVTGIIKGGNTRTESVLNGIYASSEKATLIAIHDGARPCVNDDTITKAVKTASEHHACAPAIPITSTIKKISKKTIRETIDREGLYEIQTPQVFNKDIIKVALSNVLKNSIDITDDCMAAEIIKVPVYTIEGSRRNIKITDVDDLFLAETFLKEREEECE